MYQGGNMEYSQNGLHLTEQFEECRLTAYPDSKGIPTIGWGPTLGVQLGDTCTQEQADAWLLQDVQNAVNHVNSLVFVPLTQGEFDALVDFSFNCGCEAFAGSTMLRLLNAGDYSGAADQFEHWGRSGGKVIAGLLRRRQTEVQEFNNVRT
jgi:lysozyme